MLLIDPSNGNIVKANASAARFYGYSKPNLEKMTIQQMNTFSKEQVKNEMKKAKVENRNYFIFRHRLADNSIKRVEVYSHPITYGGKKVLFSTIHDVSNLELVQNTLEHYSQTLEQQVDLKSQELIKSEKELRYILISSIVILLITVVFLTKAVLVRKIAEKDLENSLKKLKDSEQQMKNIIESFPIPIIKAAKDNINVEYFNSEFQSTFGWALDEISTMEKWFHRAYPDETYRNEVMSEWMILVTETNKLNLNTSAYPMIVHVICKDGSTKECQIWYHTNLGNIYGIFYDVTKIKVLEKENLQQQKMLLTQTKIAAIGEMLGNIAHQWRQLLSIITTSVSGLKVAIEFEQEITNEMLLERVESVMKQAQYLSQTIDDFKNFFTSDSEIIEEFNIKDTIEKLYGLIHDTIDNNYITYEVNLEDIMLKNNENKLIQALLNIFNNAKDAIVQNEVDSDERFLFVKLSRVKDKAVISIQDSAGGIKDDVIDKIFEPYFTTKHKSVGTGVGLYMTYQIIKNNFHGEIIARNIQFERNGKKFQGAEFSVEIPLV